jgi:glutaredoxin
MGDSFYRVIAAAAVSVLLSAAPSGAEAGCSKSVTMYNAWWCPYCRQVRAILARNHIRYTVLDATTPQVKAIMLRRFGDTGVPRTVIGGVVVEGVDEERIKQLCAERPKMETASSSQPFHLLGIAPENVVD